MNNNNSVYKRLLEIIKSEENDFKTLVDADNILGTSVTSEEILNYLEFTQDENVLNAPIVGNILITEGDILSILKIIHDIVNYSGKYIIHINDDNLGTNTYLVKLANKIYQELKVNVILEIDYSKNYNKYLNDLVTIIGSDNFVKTVAFDFPNANQIII